MVLLVPYVMSHFFFQFQDFLFSFGFQQFTYDVSMCSFFVIILGVCWTSWIHRVFFVKSGRFSAIISSNLSPLPSPLLSLHFVYTYELNVSPQAFEALLTFLPSFPLLFESILLTCTEIHWFFCHLKISYQVHLVTF